ncbi:Membrane bound O-acyl transferase, MBOAT [Metarhizium album ARSEF 1941]|uniref:Membrane bound O-acyl transferase, MBOAT n=1 Tax=Metarhizium album (strain ARSEF 1941) TaxID=1081103 RepID=A0A0B2WLJ9_METAS|nr:Membrane bound O-acyl transferase, MBOAT [Metarhizium album ARSEF 1941]KHN94564.1 Membrane bound O-acyl transferase, MBOAT [Metarhizium album ARSEF 1941]
MGVFSFLRKVYDIDTLDTRFMTSSRVPYQTVIEARSDPHAVKDAADKARALAPPAKWQTPEFYLYYIVFLWAVPYMFWVAYSVSRPSDPRYHKYARFLSDGWIPGRKVDVSDAQYHTFRGNLPYLAALLIFHPLLRKFWESVCSGSNRNRSPQGSVRLEQRAVFDFMFALLFLVVLHGISAFKVLAILYMNFQMGRKFPPKYVPIGTWIFNISILFANELCDGYQLRSVASHFSPPVKVGSTGQATDSHLMQTGAWLDGFGGIMPRWEVLFNITILRLISYNMDYYWSIANNASSSLEVSPYGAVCSFPPRKSADKHKKKQVDMANLSERDRINLSADAADYSFRNYVAYAIYAPLYLAGPILTFNDYVSQLKFKAASIEKSRTIRYGVRFLLVLLVMELILHFDYVGAISLAKPVWGDYSAAQLSLLSFFNLHIIWLKLLLPWRLFRLWALMDGIDPPENMVRCVSNNYSTQLFWRAWHRSYNRWLIRYLYVPLGGASFRNWAAAVQSTVTYLCVFTFVALWHDIQLRLLIWGWLIVLFMVPEWTAAFLFPKRKWESRPTEYRMLCCVGAVANVLMMMAANLVGFAVGLDGLQSIVAGILHEWSGVLFLVVACACLFVGVQVMFEIRASETRKGVTLKC